MTTEQPGPLQPNTANGELGHCEHCGRATPFTAAILMALPLGMICTCAIESRMLERINRQASSRLREPGGTYLR